MNEIELYEFDRQGYIVIRDFLRPTEVDSLSGAIDNLEQHALVHVDKVPRKKSPWGPEYHRNPDFGYHVHGSNADGETIIIEDYWNANPAFDVLLDHSPTMKYVHAVVQGRPTINNSEIRIRYRGNSTVNHGSGASEANGKYRYNFNSFGIDCMMVRMVYFVHDVSSEQGAFCVVPGTHKANVQCPYDNDPDIEPGVVGLEVNAGDAIFFTESLRHGGLTNQSEQARKTLHVGYGPHFLMSQNIATMDEIPYITNETRKRLTDSQFSLFRSYPENGS